MLSCFLDTEREIVTCPLVAGHAAHLFFRTCTHRDIFQIDDLSALGRDRHLFRSSSESAFARSLRRGKDHRTARHRRVKRSAAAMALVIWFHRHLVLLHLTGSSSTFTYSEEPPMDSTEPRGELLEHRRDVLVDVIVRDLPACRGDGEHDVDSAVHVSSP